MKKTILLFLSLFSLSMGVAVSPVSIGTMTELKAQPGGFAATVETKGRYVAGDGGGLVLDWNGSISTTPDSCTFFKPTNGGNLGRWVARHPDPINPRACGAKGDGVTNDYVALNAARLAASGKTLLFTKGSYYISSALTFDSTVSVVMQKGAVIYGHQTVNIKGPFEAGEYQVFSDSITASFHKAGETKIAWFYNGLGKYAHAINRAIACHGDSGNHIQSAKSDTMYIDSTIVFNNSHVTWEGYGASGKDNSMPRIIWAGAVGGTMLTASGPDGSVISKIAFDGNHIAKWGWSIDTFRKSQVYMCTFERMVGFIYSTNCYYSEFKNILGRLQTPGTYIGHAGQVSLVDWQDVNNSAFSAPFTFQSNANNIRIERLELSQVGAYELPSGGSKISQFVLLGGQNIEMVLPTFETVGGSTIPAGPEDGDKVLGSGQYTGIIGCSQLVTPVLSGVTALNSSSHLLYGKLTNSGSTRTVQLYSNSGRTLLVAKGTLVGDGVMILHSQNSSGIHGQVTVTYTSNDLSWTWRWGYETITNVVRIGTGYQISVDNIYMEGVFSQGLLIVSPLMRGGLDFGKIYAEDCDFAGSLINSGSLKDIHIGNFSAKGSTFAGPYLSDNSSSTHIVIDQTEFHNRYDSIGGVNYSDETLGYTGMASTNGNIPIIYQPQVVSGLVADTSHDVIGNFIKLTPGSILNGLGESVIVGRYEEEHGLSAFGGYLFRPNPTDSDYNLAVDAQGFVFIENQLFPKATATQGKITLATFHINSGGVFTSLSVVSSPSSLRGITLPNTGGLTLPGTGPLTRGGFDVFTDHDHEFHASTADASDSNRINITGGGLASITRGAIIQIGGNEFPGDGGTLGLSTGNVTGSKIKFVAQGSVGGYMDNNGAWSFTPLVGTGTRYVVTDASGVIGPGASTSGTGTVTSVSVTTANGVSGSVANPTTTPAISLTLGAITPTSVVASGAITGSNFNGFANPSVKVGKTAVNGSAITAKRSDGASALDTTLAWGWSGNHRFYDSVRVDSVVTLRAKVLDTLLAAPSTPASGTAAIYVDATNKNLTVKNDAGTVSHTAQTTASTGSQWFSAFAGDGSFTKSQPAFTDISGAILTAQITDANVTYAKLANLAGLSIMGRSANSTGVAADITGTDGQVLRVSGTALGFGAIATAGLANSAVTLAKIADQADQTILGNRSGGVGPPSAMTAAQTKTLLSLGNVENTALSTWAGSTSIVTIGTLTNNLLFTDATYDIGASGATRPRDLFLSRTAKMAGNLTLSSTTGTIGVGVTAQPDAGLYVSEFLTGLTGTTAQGILSRPKFDATVQTVEGSAIVVQLRTAATAGTMGIGDGLHVGDANKGATSAITVQNGVNIDDQTQGGTNNAIKTGIGYLSWGDVMTMKSTTFSNAAYTFPTPAAGTGGIQYAGQVGTMSASRVVTLPPANKYPRGTLIMVIDESGTTTAINTLVITAAGSDKINGAATKTIGITGGYDVWVGMSDGTSKWTTITSI